LFPILATLTLLVALCEMFSDQVQIVSPRVEPENWHLIAPFFDFDALHFWKHPHVVRHKRCSYFGPNVFPAPLQFFHKLADQFHRIFFTDVCGRSKVSPTLTDIGTCAFSIVSMSVGSFR